VPCAPAAAITTAVTITTAEEARTEVTGCADADLFGMNDAVLHPGCRRATSLHFLRVFVKDGATHRSKMQEFASCTSP
jgi:hypothetical protein